MSRIAGVDIPTNKRVEIALTYVYGIGRSLAQKILTETKIDFNTKVSQLTEKQLVKIRQQIELYSVEGDLRRKVALDIKRLMDLGNYRGLRHRRRLPVRGQRTKTNARTRKSPRRA